MWLSVIPFTVEHIYMTLAVNITDGCGLSNEEHHELLPKEEQGNGVFAVH